ncbi:MAG: hypothetical protein KDB88_05405 [Flavobacteriales bacterium]|nr:hypothetical protein [Flavobacteriales bacterium]
MSDDRYRRIASRVILVRPTGFGFDPETAASNTFQRDVQDRGTAQAAAEEFDGLLYALDRMQVGTLVLDPTDPTAPNAVFPNNWFSTHADGTVVLYPMLTPGRRREVDHELHRILSAEGYDVTRKLDLTELTARERFLEGTGSLVLDRKESIAFAALSPRTSHHAINRWCALMDHGPVLFTATMDGTLTGDPVYHTNVVMAVGDGFALACLDAVPYPADRQDLLLAFERAGLEFIPISLGEMHAFAGNVLQLDAPARPTFLSTTAFEALTPSARQRLEHFGQLVPVPIPTIETIGGGSVRCMLAENFLPLRQS